MSSDTNPTAPKAKDTSSDTRSADIRTAELSDTDLNKVAGGQNSPDTMAEYSE